jgi:hypothetical protein
MLKQLCKALPPEASVCITQALIWRSLDVLSTIFNRTITPCWKVLYHYLEQYSSL